MSLFKTKHVATLISDSEGEGGMKRELNALNLISLGIGSVVGAGIFVLAGTTAAQHAGPAIVISFMISGLGCLFAGLCYAEFATMIPVAGSAYTYTYATMGEFLAWIIGWDLILEYLFSGAAVAVSWSASVQGLLGEFGIKLPQLLGSAPFALEHGHLVATGTLLNVPAVFISLALTVILVIGIKESATFNNWMVFIKVGVLLVLIGYGGWWVCQHFEVARQNWTPFLPANTGKFGEFGWSGVCKGAAVIFFAYVGFDNVSCAAQETKNPRKEMPIGLLGTLVVCSFLFIAVALVITGLVKYPGLNVDAPFIFVLQKVEAPAILRYSIEVASIAGLTSVALVSLLGQPRIFFSMAKDGLLPSAFSKLHPRFRTPYISTILTGVICSIVAGLLPLDLLGELISIGTLMAFTIVCLGILVLRRTRPDLPRPFRTPWVPLVPILGVLTCMGMMFTLPGDTWLRLGIWMGIGLVVYFSYSVRHSTLRHGQRNSNPQSETVS